MAGPLTATHFPSATQLFCRLGRDTEGRLFIDTSNAGLPVEIVSDHRLQISDVLPGYTRSSQPEAEPVNLLGEKFAPMVQPDCVQRGEAPLLSIQLTQVHDGSIVGVSFSHTLAGE